jgi:hypothetical protein
MDQRASGTWTWTGGINRRRLRRLSDPGRAFAPVDFSQGQRRELGVSKLCGLTPYRSVSPGLRGDRVIGSPCDPAGRPDHTLTPVVTMLWIELIAGFASSAAENLGQIG